MRDQYDDGRYDGWGRNMGIYQSPPPRLAAPRGGIKYPYQPITKEAPMAQSVTQKLAALKNKQENLAAEIATLERAVKAQRLAPPSSDQQWWTVDVRFTPGGALYTYLVLRHAGMYYTTGTGEDKRFMTWGALLDWLGGMASHSAMLPLEVDYDAAVPLEGRRN